jgi:uncharacterized protein
MRYNFEWDPNKADQNLRKHGISFERSVYVFRDPLAISIYDDEHSTNEDRWITIGKNGSGILLVVIHTFRKLDESSYSIRIISSRKATKAESKQYKEP